MNSKTTLKILKKRMRKKHPKKDFQSVSVRNTCLTETREVKRTSQEARLKLKHESLILAQDERWRRA